jgi:hypothetical protein
MKKLDCLLAVCCLLALSLTLIPDPAAARNPYRRAFFNVYSSANNTVLDDVPSNAGHCGVCHFDFDGSAQRNPYGLAVEVGINSGQFASTEDVIISLDGLDSDNDGYTNHTEITSLLFTNTPTFPGLKASNYTNTVNVNHADIVNYLTPLGSTDTTPPVVTVLTPNGGENYGPTTTETVTWTATDASGISHVNIYLSDDGGSHFKPIATNLPSSGSFSWFVPNLPGAQNLISVVAYDNAGNDGNDLSDLSFTIDPLTGGIVPTTLRDFEMAGTQPFESGILEDPSVNCVTCHGEYDHVVEPWHTWRGSMMSHAMRDPLFIATMVVAEQQAPGAGDLCLRCHTPGGWQEGRSTDTSGGMVTSKDRQGVQCDYCHRLVDPQYKAGISPPADEPILNALAVVPLAYANGQFVTDPDPVRRGPYADAQASHQFLESPFHRTADLCGTCHDVSNPAFVQGSNPAEYVPQDFDTPHPDGNLRNMFPVERTYSEWSMSEYASTGVYAPLFAGNKPGGIVSTCQDCHMKDVAGAGSSEPGSPTRTDLPLHDLTGGNYFIPDLVQEWFPADGVTAEQLQDGQQRALHMLSLAASMNVATGQAGGQPTISVAVTNETGHKLPSGYPEGRRIWLNVRAYDTYGALVYESGGYDIDTGLLTHDEDLKIYEIKPGISTRLASLLELTAGPSFNFVLNDSVYKDNRIPPRGFTNAAFAAIQSPPVGHAYADGQYSDTTTYTLPAIARDVEVFLYYQTTSKEYVEFLRDQNVTDTTGQDLHDSWVAHGRCAPVAMEFRQILLDVTGAPELPEKVTMLAQNYPNPFNPATTIRYALEQPGRARLTIYDERGRLVRALVDAELPAGPQEIVWNGMDDAGRRVASGVYHYVLKTNGKELRRKMVVVK